MSAKSNTDEFIKKAINRHGYKYIYDKVQYTNAHKKIVIICPEHGDFIQKPNNHLIGHGCPKCRCKFLSIKYRKDEGIFIEKSIIVHNGKYNYDRVDYVNTHTIVTIICPEHGEFKQIPNDHLRGHGCAKCAGCLKLSNQEFIERSNIIHNHKYNYDKVDYISSHTKVVIICPEHGEFEQEPNWHLNGHGCFECNGTKQLDTDEFIRRAKIVHGDKYNYNKSKYKNTRTRVTITCPTHGDFTQTPDNHLYQGSGCSKCISVVSYIGSRWLDSLGIPNDYKHREVRKLIPGRSFSVDGYIPETHTVYEFYGDDAHGNPGKYKPSDINRFGMTYREAYEKTIEREEIFKAAGFNLVTIWESDYRKQLLREFVENQSSKATSRSR